MFSIPNMITLALALSISISHVDKCVCSLSEKNCKFLHRRRCYRKQEFFVFQNICVIYHLRTSIFNIKGFVISHSFHLSASLEMLFVQNLPSWTKQKYIPSQHNQSLEISVVCTLSFFILSQCAVWVVIHQRIDKLSHSPCRI